MNKWNLYSKKKDAIKTEIKCTVCGSNGYIETAIVQCTEDEERGIHFLPIVCPNCIDYLEFPIKIGERIFKNNNRKIFTDNLIENKESV